MYSLFKFLFFLARNFYELLDPNKNGLKNAPMQMKYIISVWLACFWALAFSLYTGEIMYLGYNVFGHLAIVSMAFVTWLVVRTVQKEYPDRPTDEQFRQPDRSPRDQELSDNEKWSWPKGTQ